MIRRSVFLIILLVNLGSLQAQHPIPVIAGDFKVYPQDSAFGYIAKRLPDLVCNGIFYQSSLSLYTGYRSQPTPNVQRLFKILKSQDKAMDDLRKRALDSLQVAYVVDGDAVINKEEYSLFVSVTNYAGTTSTYEIKSRPKSQLLDGIDEACLSLNRMVQMDKAGQKAVRIGLQDFKVRFAAGTHKPDENNTLSQRYFSLFLAQNLHNSDSGWYVIKPYDYQGDSLSNSLQAKDRSADFNITGTVRISHDTIKVYAIGKQLNGDSVVFAPFEGTFDKKEELAANLLDYLQAYLDVVINGAFNGHVSNITFDRNQYIQSFKDAYAAGQLRIASFYARELILRDPKNTRVGTLFNAMVNYKKGKYEETIRILKPFLNGQETNTDAAYFSGLAYCRLGLYEQASRLLKKVPGSMYQENVHYYLGTAEYYMDSLSAAKDQFQLQIQKSNLYPSESRYYLGMIAAIQKQWREADSLLRACYAINPNNPSYSRDIRNLYKNCMANLVGEATTNEAVVDSLVANGIKENFISSDDINEAASTIDFLPKTTDPSQAYFNFVSRRMLRLFSIYRALRSDISTNALETIAYLSARTGDFEGALESYKQIFRSQPFKKENGVIYMSMAELYLLNRSYKQADSLLLYIRSNLGVDSTSGLTPAMALLLNFYEVESNILQQRDPQHFPMDIDTSLLSKPHLDLSDWSFGLMYKWIQNQQLDPAIKQKLLSPLCKLVPISGDTFPCN